MDDATVGNWVGQFTNTTGQGPIVISGTIAGYTSFESIAGDDVDFWYAIVDGDNREAGIGNYNGGFFYRNTIFSTLVNGQYYGGAATPLDLSGSAEIYSTFNKTAFDDLVNHVNTTDIHFPDAPANGIAYNRKDGAWAIASSGGGGSGGGSTEISVPQTAHGFSVLDCVRFDSPSTGYILALADDPATLAIGVVTSVVNANEFVLSLTGIYPLVHGLAEETWWYLSDTVPGQLTEIEPDISQPIVYTQGPSSFLVFEYRPSSPTEIEVFGGAGLPGIVPDPITEQNYYLRDDATWQPAADPFVPSTFTGAGSTGYVPDPTVELGYFLDDAGNWSPAPVSPIGGVFVNYQWSSGTTPPAGAGDISVNNADQTLATELYASGESNPGNDINFIWENVYVGEYIGVWEAGGESVYYAVTGDPVYTLGTDSWVIPVVYVSGAGGLDNNRAVQCFFIANPSEKVPTGGTTGQVLTKNSNADFDDSWQDPGSGGDSYWEPGANPNDIINTNSGNVIMGAPPPTTPSGVTVSHGANESIAALTLIPSNAGAGAFGFRITSAYADTSVSMDKNGVPFFEVDGFSSPNTLKWSTGGTERMRITSTGNVGIGTDDPATKLDVDGNLILRGAGVNGGTLELRDTAHITSVGKVDVTEVSVRFMNISSDLNTLIGNVLTNPEPVQFWTNGSEKMRITADGNVGIGAQGTRAKLEITPAPEATLPVIRANVSEVNSWAADLAGTGPLGSTWAYTPAYGELCVENTAWGVTGNYASISLFAGLNSSGGSMATARIAAVRNSDTGTGCDLAIYTRGGNERFRIESNGIVRGVFQGVGITQNQSRFEVVAALPGTPDANTIYFVTG